MASVWCDKLESGCLSRFIIPDCFKLLLWNETHIKYCDKKKKHAWTAHVLLWTFARAPLIHIMKLSSFTSWRSLSPFSLLGSLKNDDCNGDCNGDCNATATATPQINHGMTGWMWKNNRAARAARFLVHFFDVEWKTTMWNFHIWWGYDDNNSQQQ